MSHLSDISGLASRCLSHCLAEDRCRGRQIGGTCMQRLASSPTHLVTRVHHGFIRSLAVGFVLRKDGISPSVEVVRSDSYKASHYRLLGIKPR